MLKASSIVEKVRALDGLTRTELAALADVAPSTISRIERGVLDPTWTTLQRILEATGFRISGDAVVPAGDTTAIDAARAVIEGAPMVGDALKWISSWARAGWVGGTPAETDIAAIGVVAGNAAKITRRPAKRCYVRPDGSWADLARQMGDAGVEYAISGLIAARPDRAVAGTISPMIYVADPEGTRKRLGLVEGAPRDGVLLLEPERDELAGVTVEGGLRFVSPAQGLLDAFSASGRQPDKAEALAKSWNGRRLAAA